ncbi:MAG: efflux transporter outer membrane subunit [Pseudazoarcus pumilus]|nr:efflux transporter outer membrane subunit [Pseudazoarcus pumilus]
MMFESRLPLVFASVLVLAGCSLAPKYEVPEVATPTAFRHAEPLAAGEAGKWKTAEPAEAAARGEWWKVFDDPVLDALQAAALDANQDLRAAAARLQQSRAVQRSARADRFPSVDGGFGPTRQRPSPASQGLPENADTDPNTLWRAQLGLSYEIDVFGRVANSVSAASASLQRDEALFRSVLLALQADVAHTYFQLRELDAEQAIFANTVALRAKGLRLMERRFAEGFIGELDVARSRTELATAQSDALGVQRQRAVAEHALALLLGRSPADFRFAPQPLARITVSVPPGLPSELLERRPDIAAAERAMAAANARIGVARAAFFPSLTLTGAAGFESGELGDLFQWSSRTFLLGPVAGTLLSLPLFDGGRRRAGVDRAWAVWEEDVALYRQTVLNAFREVEDGLAGLRILSEQTRAQDSAVAAAERAVELSRVQYREGAVSYLDVIEADRSALAQQRGRVRLDAERARTVVSLIRALGGGWNTPRTAAADPAVTLTAAVGNTR